MPDTIHFKLHNNYSDDVQVVVYDMYGGVARQTWNGPLNKDETAPIEVYAGSDGTGAAQWVAAGGPTNTQTGINDGDTCELNA